MLAIATINFADLHVDELVDVDPEDEIIAGYLRARYLVPVEHQPMSPADIPSTASRPHGAQGAPATISGPE